MSIVLPFEEEYDILNQYIKKQLKTDNNWYSFKSTFSEQGKQGYVGILDLDDIESDCVFKTSQRFNYLVKHEYLIMKSLRDIKQCCPYFGLGYGILKFDCDFNYKNKRNIFDCENSKHFINSAVLMQNYRNLKDFTEFIYERKSDNDVIFSTVKMVLCALSISQNLKDFCHYDLHSSNILMCECDKDLVMVHNLDNNNSICVPTNGFIPKIIDYGFSYCKDMENKNFYATLAHTDVGMMSCTNDFMSDLKLFLISTSYDIKYRHTNSSDKYRNIVQNIFRRLDIDWKHGWDNYERIGASDHIIQLIENVKHPSKIFKDYDYHCIDILQSLIVLPLRQYNTKNLKLSYQAFLVEFNKIEVTIKSTIIHLYIFKIIVDIARELKKSYKKNKTETVQKFKLKLLSGIDKLVSFFNPKNINYEKMLCSLYVFAECCEGVLYDQIQLKLEEQDEEYSKLKISTPEQIYACIEVNIPNTYVYNKNSKFLILDSSENNRQSITNPHPFLIKLLNMSNSLFHGCIINDYHKDKFYQDIYNYYHPILPEPEPEPKPPKKKRGRPKKVSNQSIEENKEENPKKKRGRPKKVSN